MPIIDKTNAKVKLWIGMPTGENNQTWYNFNVENKYANDVIVTKMTKRILNDKLEMDFVVAKFFDKQTGELISELKRVEQ